MITREVDTVMPAALAVVGMTKSFGSVKALTDVSLSFFSGQVTALLGENGAGKSTLIRLCSGEMQPDRGTLTLAGTDVLFESPLTAIAHGVVVVHQEPMLVGELTIADNLFLYDLGERRAYARARRAGNARKARELLERLQMADYVPDPVTLCRDLSAAARQMVDIVRALSRDPKVLFLDEPNSSLTHEESERLFRVVKKLRDDGVAVVLVSHRLAEVYSIADHVIVLRDGTFIAEGDPKEVDQDRAVALMAGDRRRDEVADIVHDRQLADEATAVALEVAGLTGDGFTDVSFTIRRGEIVGMAGLVGAGRTEIAEAVVGLRRVEQGRIFVDGHTVHISGPGKAQKLGVAYVAEERRTEVFHAQSVGYNLTVRILATLGRFGWVSGRRSKRAAKELKQRYGVKAESTDAPITSLSGGNQQKVLLARALAAKPRVLILDEPTRGVDVGTKGEIYATLRGLAHTDGLAVWFISSELEEVVELADRVLVVRQGRITRDAPNDSGPNAIVAAAMGGATGGLT